jgi:hypothetical protein
MATIDDLAANLHELRQRLEHVVDAPPPDAPQGLNSAMAELLELFDELGDRTALELCGTDTAEIDTLNSKATRVLELWPA